MNKFRRFGQLLAATTASATILAGAPAAFAAPTTTAAPKPEPVVFSVNNITDFHGHIESKFTADKDTKVVTPKYGDEMGAARIAALLKHVNEGQEYAMTTSGDNVGGSAFVSAISEDAYTIKALNEMGVVASVAGNHEFDKGSEDLLNRIKPASEFPILGANVIKDGKPLLDASVVKEINGVKVGFVGVLSGNTEAKVAPALIPGVSFEDPVAYANKEASRLKKAGEADVVVVLLHEDAKALAKGFNQDVDLLFGGDSHAQYVGKIDRACGTPLVYAQSMEYGKLLSDADITFDKTTKQVTKIELTQYDATTAYPLTEDATIAGIVAEAKTKADELGSEVIGTSPANLYRGSNDGEASGSNRGVESTLNNYIAEAQRVSMEKATGKTIDVAVMNAGGVRADLDAGETTFAEVFTVQPFGNSVGYGTISGADLITALENQWKPGQSRPRLDLGLSQNVNVVYNQFGAQGARIQQVNINGEPIDPAKDYTIAMSTFLRDQGDGFFAEGMIKNFTDVGYMDTKAMGDYIASGTSTARKGQSQIGASVEGELKAGNKVTVNLSSLNYSTAGEPMATTVTVALGDQKVSAPIDNTLTAADMGLGEIGRASVELTLPANFTGKEDLVITTDAGTNSTLNLANLKPAGSQEAPAPAPTETKGEKPAPVLSITAEATKACEPKEDGLSSNSSEGSSEKDGEGSNAGSAIGGTVAAILTALAAVVGVAHFAGDLLPAPVRKMIEDLCAQFGMKF